MDSKKEGGARGISIGRGKTGPESHPGASVIVKSIVVLYFGAIARYKMQKIVNPNGV